MFGIIFDYRRKLAKLIQFLKTITNNSLNIVKILTHTSWEEDSKTLITIHKPIIQSKLNYGSILYKLAAHSKIQAIESSVVD